MRNKLSGLLVLMLVVLSTFGFAAYSGDGVAVTQNTPATDLVSTFYNDDTDASSDSIVRIRVGSDAAGDAYTRYGIVGTEDFSIGIDNSDGNNFKIGNSGQPGTGDILVINSSTNAVDILEATTITTNDDTPPLTLNGGTRNTNLIVESTDTGAAIGLQDHLTTIVPTLQVIGNDIMFRVNNTNVLKAVGTSRALEIDGDIDTVDNINIDNDKYINMEDMYISTGQSDSGHISTHVYRDNGVWVFDGTPGGLFQIDGSSDFVSYGHNGSDFTEQFRYDKSGTLFKISGGKDIGDNITPQQYTFGGSGSGAGNSLEFNWLNNESTIQGIDQGTAFRNLRLNPYGGYVSIGDVSPTQHLHVYSDSVNTAALFESSDSGALIAFKDNDTTTKPLIGATGDSLKARVGNNNMIGISSTAVGIGDFDNNDQQHFLHIRRETTGTTQVGIDGNGVGADAQLYYKEDGNNRALLYYDVSAAAFKMYNYQSGTTMIYLNDDSTIDMPGVYSNTVGGTNRDLYIDNTGQLGYLSSSERYKKNIVPISDTSWIYSLDGKNFDYKDEEQGVNKMGLIAEEVETVNPNIVSYNILDNGTKQIETVNYNDLITPMLDQVQKLEERIRVLEAQLNITSPTHITSVDYVEQVDILEPIECTTTNIGYCFTETACINNGGVWNIDTCEEDIYNNIIQTQIENECSEYTLEYCTTELDCTNNEGTWVDNTCVVQQYIEEQI